MTVVGGVTIGAGYETVMEVSASSVMKEKAIEMKKAIDNQMTWESIVRRIEDLV